MPEHAASGHESSTTWALVFWAYILFALVFTSLIALDNYKLYKSFQNDAKLENRHVISRLKVMAILSIISFTTLSYEMLFFLIDSFLSFQAKTATNVTGHISTTSPSSIWLWSTHVRLFEDFAMELCGDTVSFYWTKYALSWTMAVCIWMSYEGTRWQIPNLHRYFVLSQILPISFTQNLFGIAILLHRSDSRLNPVKQNRTLYPPQVFVQVVVALACAASMVLATIRLLADDVSNFMICVGFMRLLLLVPFIIMTPCETHIAWLTSSVPSRPQENLSLRYVWTFALLLGCTQCVTITMHGVPKVHSFRGLLQGGYAARTVAFDFLIGAISALYGVYAGVVVFE